MQPLEIDVIFKLRLEKMSYVQYVQLYPESHFDLRNSPCKYLCFY